MIIPGSCFIPFWTAQQSVWNNPIVVNRILPSALQWNGILWNGTSWCIYAYASDQVLVSSNGVDWTQHTIAGNSHWASNIWTCGAVKGSTFCIAGHEYLCATSNDGINWVRHTMPYGPRGRAMAANDEIFCALQSSGTKAWTSSNGSSWTERTLPVSATWESMVWGGTKFCAVGNNVCITSPDGITWTQQTMPVAANWRSVAWNGTVFCTVANASNIAATSPDGINWTQQVLPSTKNWYFAKGNNDAFLIGTSNTADGALSTDNGVTWIPLGLIRASNALEANEAEFLQVTWSFADVRAILPEN